jgi:hypothetical protein
MEGVSQKPVESLCGFGDCANYCAVERHAPVEPVGRQRRPTRKVQVGVCHEELRPAQPNKLAVEVALKTSHSGWPLQR